MNKPENKLVIVFSENGKSGIGAVRALAKAGFIVDLISTSNDKLLAQMAAESKYINQCTIVDKRKKQRAVIDKILEAFLAYEGKYDYKPLIFPADDFAAAVVNHNRDILEDLFVMPCALEKLNKNLNVYLERGYQNQLAKEAGFKVLKEVRVNTENLDEVKDQLEYPCKCVAFSRLTFTTENVGVANDYEELVYMVNKIDQKYQGDTLVRVHGDVEKIVRIPGVLVDGQVVIPGLLVEDLGDKFKKTTFASDKSTEELRKVAGNLMAKLAYNGPFEIVLEYVDKGLYFDSYKFTGGEGLYAGYLRGVNCAAIFAEAFYFGEFDQQLKGNQGGDGIFVDEGALLELYAQGELDFQEMTEYISKSNLKYLDDPKDPKVKESFNKIANETEVSHGGDIKRLDRSEQLVVVLSRNYATGLSVIRSLGAAGYKVDLVANAFKVGNSDIAGCSKYVNHYVEIVSKKINGGGDFGIIDELLKYRGLYDKKPVLFPTDDYTAAVMDMNRNVLENIFIMPGIVGGKQGAMTDSMNKTVQGDFARQVGLLTPKEWIIDLRKDIKLPSDITYPCFCKPVESITGYKREMAMCNDNVELTFHLQKLKRNFDDRCVLVQEFLEIENEIDFSGVALDQDIIIPAIIKKTNVAQYEKGVTLSGKVVPFDEISEIKDKIIEMMKLFHYEGMFDMEFNIVNNKLYFNEVNLRSGGPNFAYFMSGVNLPALFVNEALGRGHTEEDEKVSQYGKSFIYEKIAWEDHINGYMTKKEMEDCINQSDIRLLLSDDDPAPGELFNVKIKEEAKIKKLRKIKKDIKTNIKTFLREGVKPVLSKTKQVVFRYPQVKKSNRRDPNSEKPRVLVSGRNYCSNLCMAKALGEAGYQVEVLRIFQVRPKLKYVLRRIQPDAFSKYVKAYNVCISRRRPIRIVKKLIELADENRKMLLIPADDLVANIIDENYDILSPYYIMPNIEEKQGKVSWMMSKDVQKKAAIKAGLPVVNSCVIKTHEGQFDIPDSVTYPCFIKPNVSMKSSKSRMKKCENRNELYKTLKLFSTKKDIEMLVEDFVEIDREYSLLGVSTPDGVCAPAFFGAEEGGHEAHRGVALTGRILPVSEEQELIDKLIKFVEDTKFTGLFDVDLIKTPEGKMIFVELNLRFGASGYAFAKCGANLPGMFADYMLLNKPLNKQCEVKEPGKLFLSEKVMIDEYVESFCTKKDMKEAMNKVDIRFIYDKEDPRPYRHFRLFYPLATMVRWVRSRREDV